MNEPQERTATIRIDHERYIELKFMEVSHKAIDDLIAHLIDIVTITNDEKLVRIFVNSSMINRSQSISYLLGKLRANQQAFTVGSNTRIAVTFNLLPLASLLEMFIRSLYTGKIIFKPFSVHDTSRALDWLLAE